MIFRANSLERVQVWDALLVLPNVRLSGCSFKYRVLLICWEMSLSRRFLYAISRVKKLLGNIEALGKNGKK